MNKFTKHLMLPSLMTLLCQAPLFCEEESAPSNIETSEEHISVRSRDMESSKRENMQTRRAQERETEESEDSVAAQAILKRASAKLSESSFKLAPREMIRPQFSLTNFTFPVNCHCLTSVADNNRSIELEDGSHWEVSATDAHLIWNWRREDSLVITPNYNWFSNYDYYITNKSNHTFVKANLYVGPLAFGPYSHWIVNIDYSTGHICLENQMIWCINPQDSYLFKDWAINDHVILGVYDSWFSPYDHILINVNMDNHVRGKQY